MVQRHARLTSARGNRGEGSSCHRANPAFLDCQKLKMVRKIRGACSQGRKDTTRLTFYSSIKEGTCDSKSLQPEGVSRMSTRTKDNGGTASETPDRRRARRFEVNWPATLTGDEPGGPFQETGSVANLSSSGALIR